MRSPLLTANVDAPLGWRMSFRRTSANAYQCTTDHAFKLERIADNWTIHVDGIPVARAHSASAHPNTMDDGAWVDCRDERVITPLTFRVDLSSSRRAPLSLADIGDDFFSSFAARTNRVVWYREPISHRVYHSGAKVREGVLGRRYCPSCTLSFSANNFVSQHMRVRHAVCVTPRDVMAVIERRQSPSLAEHE